VGCTGLSDGFFKSPVKVVLSRLGLLALLNALFFGCLLVTAVISGVVYVPVDYLAVLEPGLASSFQGNWLLVFLYIFGFNLCLSALLFVTLPGIVFFPLSAALLVFRAVLWGFFVYLLPLGSFFTTLPTLLFEGEAYVFAAAGGVVTGASWLKPKWLGQVAGISRGRDFKQGLEMCSRFYVFVVLLLLVAAAVETLSITLGA
jgi:hypothetical protein